MAARHPFARSAAASARRVPPHPSNGGSTGYSYSMRQQALAQAANPAVPAAAIVPCARTLRRWRQRLGAHVQTGNAEATLFMNGDLALIILFRLVYPKVSADEIIAFVATNGLSHRFYSRAQITIAEQMAGFSRKRASTVATQALFQRNLVRRQLFYNSPYPLGIVGTPRHLFIDVDEGGFDITRCNSRIGKAHGGDRAYAVGHYTRQANWNLILACDCSDRIWYRFSQDNTDEHVYADFLGSIIASLPPQGAAGFVQRTFLHDNLRAHLTGTVTNRIVLGGHRVIARPPYRPTDGPIEYVINQVQTALRKRAHTIFTHNDMMTAMGNIVLNISGVDATFVHCGYP